MTAKGTEGAANFFSAKDEKENIAREASRRL
jgi:hypothetical protein